MSGSSPTAQDVAAWMATQVTGGQWLYQDGAAATIEAQFGSAFIYYNDNGNPAIDKKVLAAFNKLTAKTVVWSRSERCWRERQPGDTPGRQQY